jgi:hypothetical protein
METKIASFNDSGVCFLCGVGETDPLTESSSLNRRRFLSGGVIAGATFAAMAGTPSRAFARKTPARVQPPHRDCIIEASWAMTTRMASWR